MRCQALTQSLVLFVIADSQSKTAHTWLFVVCQVLALLLPKKNPTKHNSESLILWKKKKERYHRLSSVLHNHLHAVVFCEWVGLPLTVQDDEWVGGSYHSSLIQWRLDKLNMQYSI